VDMVTGLDLPQRGRFADDGEHRFPVRVYFEDTDAGGVVYHANYLRFMERARSDMLACAGINQRGALEGGEGVYAITELAIRYRRAARLDDALMVASRVRELGAARCVIQQTVSRGEEIVAEAEVTAAFVTPEGKPRRQPRPFVEAFEKMSSKTLGKD
jgi:acyl-CoA thioester hydrolase